MKSVWIIATREYRRYFATPAAYAIAIFFFFIIGIFFFLPVQQAMAAAFAGGGGAPGVDIVLSPTVFLLLFVAPAITMHLLAEEQRMGTIELLLTAPVKDWELVIGKWLGSFLFTATILLATLIYPLILNFLVTPGIDQGLMVSGYLGALLFTAAILAIGVAISSLFNNQVASFFVTLAVMIFFWLISSFNQAGGNLLLNFLDLRRHFYDNFFVGVIDFRDVLYYVSVTALFLFIGSAVIEMRRWR